MKKLSNSKGLRLLLYIVVLFGLLVVDAFIWGKIDWKSYDFENDFGEFTLAGVLCFAGSIFYILAYDTLYKENAEKKGFFQKLFIFIGLVITILLGICSMSPYFQSFNEVKNYSPWAFAIVAPWLMSGLLTLFLFELKVQYCNPILKLALPYISLFACYIIYVVLGYINSSSFFVTGGIGLILCAVLLLLLILRWRGVTSIFDLFPSSLSTESDSADSSDTDTEDNSESKSSGGRKWASDPDYKVKSAINSLILEEVYGYGKEYSFSVGALYAEVRIRYYDIYPDVSLSGQFSGVSINLYADIKTGLRKGSDSPSPGDKSALQSKIRDVRDEISGKTKSAVNRAVSNLRKKYGNFDGSYKVEVTLKSE